MVKCACGCGKDIKPNKRYTHYKQRYIYGHQNKNKVKKIPIVCEYCGITNYYRPVDGKGRRFCSRECYWKWLKGKSQTKVSLQGRRNISNAKQGNKNPSWKGGITPRNKIIRQCFEMKIWKFSVFIQDNYTCQKCGSKRKIEAHHIKPYCMIMDDNNVKTLEQAYNCKELWNTENGLTLCKKCHDKLGRGRGTKHGKQ